MAQQLNISPNAWESYGLREITRREHLIELQQRFGFQTFSHLNYQSYVNYLTELALDTDKGILLAEQFVNHLRSQRILLPAINTLEQICAESIIRANKELYERLTIDLTQTHLENLMAYYNSKTVRNSHILVGYANHH